MNTLFAGVIWGWLGRRALELGGLATFIFQLFEALPPQAKQAVVDLLTGHPERVSVVALFGVGSYLWSQWMSFRATTKDQVVAGGKKADLDAVVDELPTAVTKSVVEAKVETVVARKPTLFERLLGKK